MRPDLKEPDAIAPAAPSVFLPTLGVLGLAADALGGGDPIIPVFVGAPDTEPLETTASSSTEGLGPSALGGGSSSASSDGGGESVKAVDEVESVEMAPDGAGESRSAANDGGGESVEPA